MATIRQYTHVLIVRLLLAAARNGTDGPHQGVIVLGPALSRLLALALLQLWRGKTHRQGDARHTLDVFDVGRFIAPRQVPTQSVVWTLTTKGANTGEQYGTQLVSSSPGWGGWKSRVSLDSTIVCVGTDVTLTTGVVAFGAMIRQLLSWLQCWRTGTMSKVATDKIRRALVGNPQLPTNLTETLA